MNTNRIKDLGASAEAIQEHYDVGNDFYSLWLDKTLTYSSALWKEGDTLESSQIRKIDYHIEQARAKSAKRVLDVGCGWGSVLKRLVEVYDVNQAVGITLSKTQAEWISSLNLPEITVNVESWLDHSTEESYDAIISIGAFEHFAKLGLSRLERVDVYRIFFSRCHQWLQPGGWMSLQTIACGNMLREDFSKFFASEIFKESDLPTLAEIAEASERIFEIVALRNDREDYGNTCSAWLKRLKANRQNAIQQVGEEIVRRYERYLNLAVIGFEVYGSMHLYRITLRRIDNPRM